MSKVPVPAEGRLLTHFIVSDDVERSRRFYTEVLGGETVRAGVAAGPRASALSLTSPFQASTGGR